MYFEFIERKKLKLMLYIFIVHPFLGLLGSKLSKIAQRYNAQDLFPIHL